MNLATVKKTESQQTVQQGQIIPVGQRNARLASLAGAMRRPGMSHEAIEVALLEVNRQQCSPPLPDDEVLRIARSITRYEPGPPKQMGTTSATGHFNFTDLGNAERLVSCYGEILHYCYEQKRWLVWNGKAWEWDARNKVASLAKLAVRNIYHEAGDEPDEKRRREMRSTD